MTDELVKRLRTSWDTQRSIMLQTDAWMSERHLAADRIEALTAERDRLRAALRDGRRLLAIAQDDRIRLLIQLEQCEKRHD